MQEFTIDDLKKALQELFDTGELDYDSNLSEFIKDSIDLGELIAVLKNRHGVTPKDMDYFRHHTTLGKIFNNFSINNDLD